LVLRHLRAGSRIHHGRQRHSGVEGLRYNDWHFLVRDACAPLARRVCLTLACRDNNSSWLRGLKFVLDTYAKSWNQLQ
jgi:hypothetical protein